MLEVPRLLRASWHSLVVLLLIESVLTASIEERLSVQMMMCLLVVVAKCLQASLIAVSSAWKTVQ